MQVKLILITLIGILLVHCQQNEEKDRIYPLDYPNAKYFAQVIKKKDSLRLLQISFNDKVQSQYPIFNDESCNIKFKDINNDTVLDIILSYPHLTLIFCSSTKFTTAYEIPYNNINQLTENYWFSFKEVVRDDILFQSHLYFTKDSIQEKEYFEFELDDDSATIANDSKILKIPIPSDVYLDTLFMKRIWLEFLSKSI